MEFPIGRLHVTPRGYTRKDSPLSTNSRRIELTIRPGTQNPHHGQCLSPFKYTIRDPVMQSPNLALAHFRDSDQKAPLYQISNPPHPHPTPAEAARWPIYRKSRSPSNPEIAHFTSPPCRSGDHFPIFHGFVAVISE